LQPDYIAVCLDRAEPTFRHKKFEAYKAHRPETPDELKNQIPIVKEGLRAFNIPILEKVGFEADDLISSLVGKIRRDYPYLEITIVTGDLDTLQLVQDNVKVLGLRRGLTDIAIYDEKNVNQRYGFSPVLLVDYKALRGDPSDNIPGVAGIGEKTAQELVKKYGSLEEIYQNLQKGTLKASDRVLNLLRQGKDQAFLSKELAQTREDLKIDYILTDFSFKDFSYQDVFRWFKKMRFNSLLTKIPKFEEQPSLFQEEGEKEKKKEWDLIIINKNNFTSFLKYLEKTKEFVFDTETSFLGGELVGISFCFAKNKAYFLPLNDFSDYKLWEKKEIMLTKLKPIFEDKTHFKIGHNLKYDYQILRKENIEVEPLYFDTMIASWLIDPETRNHNLERLAFLELGYQKISKDVLFKKKEKFDLRLLTLKQIAEYSAEDSWVTFNLYWKLKKKLKELKLESLFKNIEMPLVKVLAKMEERGIELDSKVLTKLAKKVQKEMIKIKNNVYRLVGKEFNLNSPIQLREILFEELALDQTRIKKTKTGLSTAASELEKMREKHKVVDLILRYRELAKLSNTYLEALPRLVDKKRRIHTNFNQTATSTGRLSSSDPNLQNIPTRTDLGQKIRRAFVAPKGKILIGADYSQIELRVIAHLSRDNKMIEAFKKREDIHSATAALIYKIPLKKITPQMRRVAKTVNFGVIYGISPYGLGQALKIHQAEAKDFIAKYFKVFNKIKLFHQKVLGQAQKKQYVETIFGRRRYLKNIVSPLPDLRSQAERAAINMPVQGTAADIIKLAMIKIEKDSEKIFLTLKMLLQVHDELVFEVDKSEAQKAAKWIKKTMEQIVKLKIPIEIDINLASSWGEMKK